MNRLIVIIIGRLTDCELPLCWWPYTAFSHLRGQMKKPEFVPLLCSWPVDCYIPAGKDEVTESQLEHNCYAVFEGSMDTDIRE